ncbi:hypothetical protein VTH06DRAFT_4693 [Thermothelomyces fergusii]
MNLSCADTCYAQQHSVYRTAPLPSCRRPDPVAADGFSSETETLQAFPSLVRHTATAFIPGLPIQTKRPAKLRTTEPVALRRLLFSLPNPPCPSPLERQGLNSFSFLFFSFLFFLPVPHRIPSHPAQSDWKAALPCV